MKRIALLLLLAACGGKADDKPKTLADYCPQTCKALEAAQPAGQNCEWVLEAECRIEADPATNVEACDAVSPKPAEHLCLDNTGTLCLLMVIGQCCDPTTGAC